MKPSLDMKPEFNGSMLQPLPSTREDPVLVTQRSGTLGSPTKGGFDPVGEELETARTGGSAFEPEVIPGSPKRESASASLGRTRQTVVAAGQQVVHVSRNGMVSTKHATFATPFGAAKRSTIEPVGSAAGVPMHYHPPGVETRDFNAEVKNSGFVPFPMSDREAYYGPAATSGPMAGPGGYDVAKADPHLSHHKMQHGVPIATFGRDDGPKKVRTPGPQDYKGDDAHNKLLRPIGYPLSFATSIRPPVKGKEGPAPHDTREAWQAMQGKHAYAYKFTTAPAHEAPLGGLPASIEAPFYDAQRSPRKLNNTGSIGRAPRVL